MRTLFIVYTLLASFSLTAQATVSQSEPRSDARKVIVYAPLSTVVIKSGTGDVVRVEHSITVDGTPRPDLSELSINRLDDAIHVEEIKPTIRSLRTALGEGYGRAVYRNGVPDETNTEVTHVLTVTIPRGLAVIVGTEYGSVTARNVTDLKSVESTYGTIEVIFQQNPPAGELELSSTYGAIDLSLPRTTTADLCLSTDYGELLTDLDLKIDGERSEARNYHQTVVGSYGGGGDLIRCRSPYGNVYLRESK